MFVINTDEESGNIVLYVRCDHCGKDHQLMGASRQQFIVCFPLDEMERKLSPPLFLCRSGCSSAVDKKRVKEKRTPLGWHEWGVLTGLFEST